MYFNVLSFVAWFAICGCASISRGAKEEIKYNDLSIPGRYGDSNDDSTIPGRYGDFSKKTFSNRDVSTSRKSDIPGRYGDFSQTSSVAGRYGDTSFQGNLKRNNGVKAYLANYDDNLFDDNSMYNDYVLMNADSPNLPGRYAGDEVNKKEVNDNNLLRKHNADTDQKDNVVHKRRIPGRYGDEEKHESDKDIPGRYGDESTGKNDADNSERYGDINTRNDRKEIPGRYGDFQDEMDHKLIPGRYGDEKTAKDTKKIPGRYGDGKNVNIEKVNNDIRQKDTRYIPGRYGDERRIQNTAQKSKQYPGKYGDEIFVKKIAVNDNDIPGRYGDETYIVGIPGRYGDETARKYILNKDDMKDSTKKKKKYRYKFISKRSTNQGHRIADSFNKRILHSV